MEASEGGGADWGPGRGSAVLRAAKGSQMLAEWARSASSGGLPDSGELAAWPAFCRFSRDSMREEPERDRERLGLSSAWGELGWLEPEATEAAGLPGAARPDRRSGLNRDSCMACRLESAWAAWAKAAGRPCQCSV